MSEENGKVCCNCRHTIRFKERKWSGVRNRYEEEITTVCEIKGRYIGYLKCFEDWCRHWASDEKKWKEVEE